MLDARGIDEVVAEAEARGVRVTRVMWCGNDGIVRSKGVTTGRLRARMAGGVGLSRAQPAQTATDRIADVPGFGPVGELRLRPDPATFRVLPYAPRTAAVLADMVDLDGGPEATCARGFLRRMEARLAAADLALRAGFENEYALARESGDGWEPIAEKHGVRSIGSQPSPPSRARAYSFSNPARRARSAAASRASIRRRKPRAQVASGPPSRSTMSARTAAVRGA